jgi:hypothetical protein
VELLEDKLKPFHFMKNQIFLDIITNEALFDFSPDA